MRHLSLFRGGFEREAAEQVARTTLSALSALLNKSLLRKNEGQRSSLHESIRQYTQEQLYKSGEKAEAHNRSTDFNPHS